MSVKLYFSLRNNEADLICCNFCNSDNRTILFTNNNFKIAKCNNCGLRYVANPPDPNRIINIYSENYFKGGLDVFGYVDYFEEEENNKVNFKKIISNLAKYSQGGKILDIGCASGCFLSLLNKNWERYGIDISAYISKHASKHANLKIFSGELMDYPCEENFFNAITFLDTLDHTNNPVMNLSIAYRLLKKDGLLIITCGDAESFFAKVMGKRWYLYIPPTHLFFFSRTILIRILKSIGFKIIKVEYSGKWVFLKLCFFRLSYIFPSFFSKIIYSFLKEHSLLGKLRLYYNFKDVMTVYAKKGSSLKI